VNQRLQLGAMALEGVTVVFEAPEAPVESMDESSPPPEMLQESRSASFETLYGQVAELLHKLQAAHLQEIGRGAPGGPGGPGRKRNLKPKGTRKMKLAAAPLSEREEEEVKENQVISQPGTAVVAMARENQDVIKVPEHLHIGRP